VIPDSESLVLVAILATPNLSLVFITPRTPSLRTLDTLRGLTAFKEVKGKILPVLVNRFVSYMYLF
jgi:hypothetical protein